MKILNQQTLTDYLKTNIPDKLKLSEVRIHTSYAYICPSYGWVDSHLSEYWQYGDFTMKKLPSNHGVPPDYAKLKVKFDPSIAQIKGDNFYSDIHPWEYMDPLRAQLRDNCIPLYMPSKDPILGKIVAIQWYPRSRAMLID